MIKKKIFSLKTRLAYLRHNLINLTLISPYKIFRRRNYLELRHLHRFNDLKTKGYTIINNYFTKEQCITAAIELKKAFESYPTFVHRKQDKRIFGVEQISLIARSLAQDVDLMELGELVNQEYSYCAFTLGNWLESGKFGSSGEGWHRDSFFSQYKALVYLTDVTKNNGPFEIIPGSHKLEFVLNGIEKAGLSHMQNRLSDHNVSRVEEVLETPRRSITAQAGTLVIFNSSSIHRGKPIKSGERIALTNYYLPISRDIRDVRKQFAPVLVSENV